MSTGEILKQTGFSQADINSAVVLCDECGVYTKKLYTRPIKGGFHFDEYEYYCIHCIRYEYLTRSHDG